MGAGEKGDYRGWLVSLSFFGIASEKNANPMISPGMKR